MRATFLKCSFCIFSLPPMIVARPRGAPRSGRAAMAKCFGRRAKPWRRAGIRFRPGMELKTGSPPERPQGHRRNGPAAPPARISDLSPGACRAARGRGARAGTDQSIIIAISCLHCKEKIPQIPAVFPPLSRKSAKKFLISGEIRNPFRSGGTGPPAGRRSQGDGSGPSRAMASLRNAAVSAGAAGTLSRGGVVQVVAQGAGQGVMISRRSVWCSWMG